MPPPIGGIHIIFWRVVDVFQGGGMVGGVDKSLLGI